MAGAGSKSQQPQQGKGKPAAGKAAQPKFRKIEGGDLPPFWDPTGKGDSVEGPIVGIRQSQFGGTSYTLRDGKRGLITLKEHSYLQNLFAKCEPEVKKGDQVRVVFTGEQTGANGKFFTYDLYTEEKVPF